MKHKGGRVMVWGCSAAEGPCQLSIIKSTMNATESKNVWRKSEVICKNFKAENRKALWEHIALRKLLCSVLLNRQNPSENITFLIEAITTWRDLVRFRTHAYLHLGEMLCGDLKQAEQRWKVEQTFLRVIWETVDDFKKGLIEVISTKWGKGRYY